MKSLSEYCDSTPLHGFGFVTKSRNIVEGVFWCVGIVVCIALTIRDTVMLIMLYLSQPTAVDIEMANDEQARRFPNTAVCVQFDRCTTLQWTLNDNFSKAFEQFSTSSQPNLLESGNLAGAVAANISAQIIVATYGFLMQVMDFDSNLSGFATCGDETIPLVLPAVSTMAAFFVQRGTNLLTFTSIIGSLLCYSGIVQMGATYTARSFVNTTSGTIQQTEALDLCAPVFWLGPPPYSAVVFGRPNMYPIYDMLCSNLSAIKPNMFENAADFISLSTTAVSSFGSDYFDVTGGEGVLDYKINEVSFVNLGSPSMRKNTNHLPGCFNVRVASLYAAQNLSRNPCGAQSQFQCRQACIAQTIAQQRGCYPIAYTWYAQRGMPATMSACVQTFNYINLDESVTMGTKSINITNPSASPFNLSVWAACDAACTLQPCTTISYEFFPCQLDTSGSEVTTTKAIIYPNGVVYANINQLLTMDIMALFVQWGGSIGLWLGGSLLAFAHVPIYFIGTMLAELCCPKKKRVESVPPISDQIRDTYSPRLAERF